MNLIKYYVIYGLRVKQYLENPRFTFTYNAYDAMLFQSKEAALSYLETNIEYIISINDRFDVWEIKEIYRTENVKT